MKKIWQKSLASMVSAALCLTAFVGCLTVNAATNYKGAITSDGVKVEATAKEATIELVVSATVPEGAKGMACAGLKVTTDYGTLTYAEVTTVGAYVATKTDPVTGESTNIPEIGADGQFIVWANDTAAGVSSFTVSLTFKAGSVTAGTTYPVKVEYLGSKDIGAADWDENTFTFTTTGVAGITVKTSHTHVYDVLKNDETNHWYECACGDGSTSGLEAHTYGAGVVTKQPTTTTTGVMTYTCSTCGYVKTEDIAIPENVGTAISFKSAINVSSVVGDSISLSTKQMRAKYGDDSSYFIVVDYQKYGKGYILQNETTTLTAVDKLVDFSTANKDVLIFKDIALYEMTLDFTLTAYFKNADGVVVGYATHTTSIANIALDFANLYPNDIEFLTAMADMCNYGAAAQGVFANQNPGSDICNAVLPTTIFADYMGNASSTDGMPAAGSYNNDKLSTKHVSTTGFVSAGQTLNIAASNQIQYTLRYDNYDFSDVVIKVHYEDSVYGPKEVVLTEADLIANGNASNGQPKYLYYFTDLSIFDCDKTVTMDMYYQGNLELTSIYSLGNYVNANLSNESLGSLLTYMELFSNSIGIKLGLDARW